MTVVTFRPRAERDMVRARLAGRNGKDAVDTALKMIRAANDEAAVHNALKMRVEAVIEMGTGHKFVHARYGARARDLLGRPLDEAIIVVENWYQIERELISHGSKIGIRRPRLALHVLEEIRIILRLIRRSEYAAHWHAILGFVVSNVDYFVVDDGTLLAVE